MTHKLIKTEKYLLVVDDSIQQIKKGEYFLLGGKHVNMWGGLGSKSLATISHKIISHLPLNGSPILEGVVLLPTIEEDVEQLALYYVNSVDGTDAYYGFIAGYDKAKEKYKYTEEDIRKAFMAGESRWGTNGEIDTEPTQDEFIKSLHQYPTEFECEMEDYCGSPLTTERCPKCIDICDRAYQRPKTITTAQGIQWVGKYK